MRRHDRVARRLAASLAAASAPAVAQSAHAAPFVQLDWRSPDECLMAASVEHSVQRLVKRAPLVAQSARVLIAKSESGWLATLDMQHGVRRLEGASCEELAETLAVVIALAIDSSTSPRLEEQASSDPVADQDSTPPAQAVTPIAASESAASRTAPADPPRNVAPEGEHVVVTVPPTQIERINPADTSANLSRVPTPQRKIPTLSGGVGAMGEWGALPSIAAAGSIGLRVAGRTWAIRARWASFFSQDASVDGRPVGTIAFRFGALEPCVASRWLTKRWELCAAFEYGSLSGSGQGVLSNGTVGKTYWYALGGSLGTWFEIVRHLQIEPRLGIAFPLFHPSFTTGEVTSVHRVGLVAGRAELNLWLVY